MQVEKRKKVWPLKWYGLECCRLKTSSWTLKDLSNWPTLGSARGGRRSPCWVSSLLHLKNIVMYHSLAYSVIAFCPLALINTVTYDASKAIWLHVCLNFRQRFAHQNCAM